MKKIQEILLYINVLISYFMIIITIIVDSMDIYIHT